jgi:hypothetical protein
MALLPCLDLLLWRDGQAEKPTMRNIAAAVYSGDPPQQEIFRKVRTAESCFYAGLAVNRYQYFNLGLGWRDLFTGGPVDPDAVARAWAERVVSEAAARQRTATERGPPRNAPERPHSACGREMPFSLPEFRAWLLEQLGGNAAGVVHCAYCTAWLNVQTLCVDNAIPLAPPWYGSLDLENLACACSACNGRKGRMSAEGFRKLVSWGCNELDERDFRDMLGRMAKGAGYLKMKEGRSARQQSGGHRIALLVSSEGHAAQALRSRS